MFRLGTLGVGLTLVAAGYASDGLNQSTAIELRSADVVQAKLELNTLGDGLESYRVVLKVAKGWHLYANLEGCDDQGGKDNAKRHPDAASVVGYFVDGRRVWMQSTYYPKGVAKKNTEGKEYFAYEGLAGVTTWLDFEDTKQAKVITAQLRVIATDGRIKLKESILTASFRE